jgi:hypothetical protein
MQRVRSWSEGKRGLAAMILGPVVFFLMMALLLLLDRELLRQTSGLVPLVALALVLAARAGRSQITLDSGGVRLARAGTKQYLQYSELGTAAIAASRFGVQRLVVYDRDGRVLMAVPLFGSERQRKGRERVQRIVDGIARARLDQDAPEQLQRCARSLPEWCAELDAYARPRRGAQYRAPFDRAKLMRLLEEGVPHELRAAATYAFLVNGGELTPEAVRRSFAEAAPPIVTAMAYLAAGNTVVDYAQLVAALPYLNAADREAVKAARLRSEAPAAPLRRLRIETGTQAESSLEEGGDEARRARR